MSDDETVQELAGFFATWQEAKQREHLEYVCAALRAAEQVERERRTTRNTTMRALELAGVRPAQLARWSEMSEVSIMRILSGVTAT